LTFDFNQLKAGIHSHHLAGTALERLTIALVASDLGSTLAWRAERDLLIGRRHDIANGLGGELHKTDTWIEVHEYLPVLLLVLLLCCSDSVIIAV